MVPLGGKHDSRSRLDHRVTRARRQHRERLHRQRGVVRRTSRDELGGKRVHLIDAQRVVERLREWILLNRVPDVRRVSCLNGQNAACRCQVRLGHDVCGGTEVCGHTHAFEHRGCSKEAGHVGVGEGVCAFLDGSGACGFESASQEGDVCLFVGGDILEACVDCGVVAGGSEVRSSEIGETLTVEGVFKVFECKGVVKDVG